MCGGTFAIAPQHPQVACQTQSISRCATIRQNNALPIVSRLRTLFRTGPTKDDDIATRLQSTSASGQHDLRRCTALVCIGNWPSARPDRCNRRPCHHSLLAALAIFLLSSAASTAEPRFHSPLAPFSYFSGSSYLLYAPRYIFPFRLPRSSVSVQRAWKSTPPPIGCF